jgi:hypothetical protein
VFSSSFFLYLCATLFYIWRLVSESMFARLFSFFLLYIYIYIYIYIYNNNNNIVTNEKKTPSQQEKWSVRCKLIRNMFLSCFTTRFFVMKAIN